MSLYLIRHPPVQIDPGICYGRLEVPLAPSFEAEAAAVRTRLAAVPLTEIWSSPSLRCRRLAELLGKRVRLDERLREMDFGAWEGRTWNSFHDAVGEAWAQDPWTRRPPQGESGEELEARVAQVRALIRARAGDRCVAVVTHAGVMRVWRRLAERASRDASLGWHLPCGSVWRVD
jgi:alpha-ribazole phosphatase